MLSPALCLCLEHGSCLRQKRRGTLLGPSVCPSLTHLTLGPSFLAQQVEKLF